MTPQPHHKYIIYVGDSFSAGMDHDHWEKNGKNRNQNYKGQRRHPSIVAKHFNLDLRNFSFAGKSWWYSRHRFYQAMEKEPDLLEKTFAIIFTHTSWDRCNTERHYIGVGATHLDPEFVPSDLPLAEELYIKHYFDFDFNDWAGQQWFREIERTFSDIPSIHFFSFPWLAEKKHLLPGMKFNTGLINIQISEMLGSNSEIHDQLKQDNDNTNHLNPHNNQVLADITIAALENYQPGSLEMDLSKFDSPNKNAFNWPHGNFGSR